MPRNTPLYGLPALAPSDRGRDIADIDWANALRIEAILANNGQLPLSADLVGLVKRLNPLDQTAWATPDVRGGQIATSTVQYCRTGGAVFLRGGHIPTQDDQLLFTLPTGFRPGMTGLYRVDRGPGATNIARISVQANGEVYFLQSGGTGAINFASVSFRADQ